jgi:hypothetical protein
MEYKMETKIYAWDFILSPGDTIKEKLESLYENVCMLAKSNIATCVFAKKKIIANIVLCSSMDNKLKIDNLKYEFFIDKKQYLGSHKLGFDMYEDQTMDDEISIQASDKRSIIKIFNYILD